MAVEYKRGLCLIYDVDKKETVVKPFRVLVALDHSHGQLQSEEMATKDLHKGDGYKELDLMNVRKCWVFWDYKETPDKLRILMPSEVGQDTDQSVLLKDYGIRELPRAFELQVLFAAARKNKPGHCKV